MRSNDYTLLNHLRELVSDRIGAISIIAAKTNKITIDRCDLCEEDYQSKREE